MLLSLDDQDRTRIVIAGLGRLLKQSGATRVSLGTLDELNEFTRVNESMVQIINGQHVVARCEPRAIVLAFGTILGLVRRADKV